MVVAGAVVAMLVVLAPGPADHRALLRELAGSAGALRSIDADIEQQVRYPGAEPEAFRGRYRADAAGRFRIDYSAPSAQRVLSTGSALYWYYPAENLVYLIDDRRYPGPAPGANPVAELMRRLDERGEVLYLGKHLHGFFVLAHHFLVRSGDGSITVDVWIEARRGVVLTRRLTDRQGREIMKERFSGYERAGGAWFPTRIDVFALSERGIVRSTTVYRNARINMPLPADIFSPSFPADAVRRRYRDR